MNLQVFTKALSQIYEPSRIGIKQYTNNENGLNNNH
jgi:hypothetical protein